MPVASIPADTKTLDLSHNRMSRLTAEHCSTGHLSAVQVLRLQNNVLTTVSTDALVNCTTLHSLYLDHNLLTSVSFVSTSHTLRELHVSFNRVTGVLDSAGAADVLPLTFLDLSHNSLRQFNSSCLLALQNVRTLNVSHNVIETLLMDDAAVLAVSAVRWLDVSSNRLRSVTWCADCVSRSLQYVDVSSNQLQYVQSTWCDLLPSLTVLILSDNPVSRLLPRTFTSCSALHTLHLSKLLIQQLDDAAVFDGLTRLRTLRLDHNSRLVSVQHDSFRHLAELAELDLRGCSLTALTFTLPLSVSVVELADNAWLCDCDTLLLIWLMMWMWMECWQLLMMYCGRWS